VSGECPWCGSKAVDITTQDDMTGFDHRRKYFCTGSESHEWRDGDGPAPAEPKSPTIAARIAAWLTR